MADNQWGLGAFVGGLQEGYQFTQDSKRRRQQEKLFDSALDDEELRGRMRDKVRKAEGLPEFQSGGFSDDPFQTLLRRGWQGLKGAFGQGAEINPQVPEMGTDPTIYMQDGYGNVGGGYANGGMASWQPQPFAPPGGVVGDPSQQRGQMGVALPDQNSAGIYGRPGYAEGGKIPNMNEVEGYSGTDPKKIAERDRAVASRNYWEDTAQKQHENRRPPDKYVNPGYAEGGKIDDEDAKRARRAKPDGPAPKPKYVEGDPQQYRPAQRGQVGNAPRGAAPRTAALPEAAPAAAKGGRLASAARNAGAVGIGYAGAAGVQGALGADYKPGDPNVINRQQGALDAVTGRGTGGIRDRAAGIASHLPGPLGMVGQAASAYRDVDTLRDVGNRAVGAVRGIGRAFGIGGEDAEGPTPTAETALPAGSAPNQAPAAPPRSNASAEVSKSKSYGQPTPAAMGPPAQAGGEFVDPLTVDLASIPDMDVKDWVDYRKQIRSAAAETGDLNQIAAADAFVDQQQHRGFLHYGNIAMNLLQNGDEEGAARSLMMAYQYFPNGSHLRFGSQNGKLVATGIDPASGKPKGAQILDPKQLAMQLANFQNPDNFKAWTLDWRAQELQETAEGRMQGTADSEANYRNRMAGAAEMNAQTNRTEGAAKANYYNAGAAGGAGAGGGLKPDTVGSAEDTFRNAIDRQMQGQALANPGEAQMLAGLMSKLYYQNQGRFTPEQIAQLVLEQYAGATGASGE